MWYLLGSFDLWIQSSLAIHPFLFRAFRVFRGSLLLSRGPVFGLEAKRESWHTTPPFPQVRSGRELWSRPCGRPVGASMRVRPILCLLLLALLASGGSCTYLPWQRPAPTAANPVFVPAANMDVLWERTIDVLHYYPFFIVIEDRPNGVIETDFKVGSNIAEPWHKESVNLYERSESTLQSIRRKVLVTIRPADGGYLVSVEAQKQLEDSVGLAANAPAPANFEENQPLQRDMNLISPKIAPSGWVPVGRDYPLEQDILERLQTAYSR